MPAVIKLQNITKTYYLGDETLHALNNVSFSVEPGEFVATTTVIGLLVGLHPDRRAAKLDPVEALRYE